MTDGARQDAITPGVPRLGMADGAALLGLVAASSALLYWNALRWYDFFDMSGFMDAGYRVYCGQVPYRDFFYNAGPVHLYMHALSYWVFGFTRLAVRVHLCAVSSIALITTFCMARRHLPLPTATLVSAVSAVCFYGPVSHPWYDQNAMLWILLGIALIDRQLPLRSPSSALWTGGACGALVAVSFLTKSNIGGAGALAFATVFMIGRFRWHAVIAALVGGLVASSGILAATGSIQGFLRMTFIENPQGNRFVNLPRLWLIHENASAIVAWFGFLGLTLHGGALPCRHRKLLFVLCLALVALSSVVALVSGCPPGGWMRRLLAAEAGLSLAAMVVLAWRRLPSEQRPRLVLLCGVIFVSLFSAWTGSMRVQANFPLAGVEAALVFVLARSMTSADVRRTPAGPLWAFAIAVLGVFGIWKTLALECWNWREGRVADYALKCDPLRGWRCDRSTGEGFDAAVEYLNRNVPRQDSLLVMPDATVAYGVTGHDSYRQAPWLFHSGGSLKQLYSPPPGRPKQAFRQHLTESPPRWILLHFEGTPIYCPLDRLLSWLAIGDLLERDYEPVAVFGPFKLLRRREDRGRRGH